MALTKRRPAMRAGFALALVLASVLPSAAKEGNPMEQARQRLEEVAAMLPARPAGFGRPIADRAAWEALAHNAAYRDVVAQAKRYAAEPIPAQPDELYLEFSRTGNRSHWEAVSGKRRDRVRAYALAECLENKGRFIAPFEALVRELCRERTWLMPAHDRSLANFNGATVEIDLGSAMLSWNLATADYLLGDRLSPETRRLMRDNIERRIFTPMRDMAAGRRPPIYWLLITNNWNAVCLACVTGSAQALLESPHDRAMFIVMAEIYIPNFLKGIGDDGYCSEGVGYWEYGFGHYVMLAETIRQATGGRIDWLKNEKVRRIAEYGRDIEIQNGVYPAFADCSLSARPSLQLMNYLSRRFGFGLEYYDAVDPATAEGRLYSAMMYSFPTAATAHAPAPAAPTGGPGLRKWFAEGGVLICRPGEGSAGRLAVALKGGNNAEQHNHNDVGSWLLVLGKRVPLADPGAEVYTARTFSKERYESKVLNSFGHPVPLVADQLQRTGPRAAGRVMKTEFTDAADTIAFDIRSAYAVKELESLTRTFVYSRQGGGSLTVTDAVAFAEPRDFETALITFGRWEQTAPGVLKITDGDAGDAESVRVEIAATDAGGGSVAFEIHPEEIHEDLHVKWIPKRLGIRMAGPIRKAAVTVRVTPWR
ncbi:MAG: heparinase II/III-family protein [bacterium]|nr:heparinase II/III-family protein [bacterium]